MRRIPLTLRALVLVPLLAALADQARTAVCAPGAETCLEAANHGSSIVVMLAYARLLPHLAERPAHIRLAVAAACLATAIGAAAVAYRWIERPAQALGRRLATQRAAPGTARRENATGSV